MGLTNGGRMSILSCVGAAAIEFRQIFRFSSELKSVAVGDR